MSHDPTLSRRLGRLIGPALMAIASSEALNIGIFANQTAPVVYLNGTILFVAGVAVICAHNRWVWGWEVLVTLAGWAALALGLYRMFLPQAPQAGDGVLTNALLAALFAVGAVLTACAYLRRSSP